MLEEIQGLRSLRRTNFAAFAQFEREMMLECQRDGIAKSPI
jgi:DNA invertase Pin-like site-specific DNA recombinase